MRVFCYDFDEKNAIASTVFGLMMLCVIVSGICVGAFLVYTSLTDGGPGFSLDQYRGVLCNNFYMYALVHSLCMIAAALVVMLLLSLFMGRLLLFLPRSYQVFFVAVFAVPVCFPSLVSVVALQQFLTTMSFMPQQGGGSNFVMFLGYVYSYLPYVFLLVVPMFVRISRCQVEAARDLGCREMDLWRAVFLPFIRKNLYITVVSVFPFIFFDITVPEVFGGGKSHSFCHFLWTFFLEFSEWRNISVIAVLCAFSYVFVCLVVKLFRYGKKKH